MLTKYLNLKVLSLVNCTGTTPNQTLSLCCEQRTGSGSPHYSRIAEGGVLDELQLNDETVRVDRCGRPVPEIRFRRSQTACST